MSRCVLDASVALRWYLRDEKDRDYALAVLAGLLDNEAVAPSLWVYEISNVLLIAQLRQRISGEQIRDILANLSALPITIDQVGSMTMPNLLQLAVDHALTAYDAAYLELARRLELPLATEDKRLRQAMAALGVELVPV